VSKALQYSEKDNGSILISIYLQDNNVANSQESRKALDQVI
jgi:hypothetical protein